MVYTTAQKNEAARALMVHLPRLDWRAARAWVTCEQGLNYNTLGVRKDGKLRTFPSFYEGALAAATVVLTGRSYARLRSAIRDGTPLDQAWAIVQSPWRLGPTGLKNAGGTDPYYLKIFIQQGVIRAGSQPTAKVGGAWW